MYNLLLKELKLSIPKFFFIMPILTGALFLIPQWPYFLALMYFCFTTAPNILSNYNSQNDYGFSIMMPVSKKEIVKSKIFTFIILELFHMVTGVFFASLNVLLYKENNFFMDLTPAFFGLAFIMYGLFNLILFPLYFRTAYHFGLPVILANIGALLFVSTVEIISFILKPADHLSYIWQLVTLITGVLLYIGMNQITLHNSYRKFDKIDL